MSVRLRVSLNVASRKYNYLDELSVIKFARIRNVGSKSMLELISLYPEMENEVGKITTSNIINYERDNR